MGLLTDLLGDGNGTSGVLIAESELESAAASITFSDIPATYRALHLVLSARSDAAATNSDVALRFNADSGANYEWQRHFSNSTTSSASATSGATSAQIGKIPAATAPANSAGIAELFITNYASATFNTSLSSEGFYRFSTGSTGMVRHSYGAAWLSTATVTSITLLMPAGSFVAGSVATLYGLKTG